MFLAELTENSKYKLFPATQELFHSVIFLYKTVKFVLFFYFEVNSNLLNLSQGGMVTSMILSTTGIFNTCLISKTEKLYHANVLTLWNHNILRLVACEAIRKSVIFDKYMDQ